MKFCRLIKLGTACMVFLLGGCAHAQQAVQPLCDGDTYTRRSSELKDIYADDQKDREDFLHWTEKRAIEVLLRDRERRLRVAEIFTQGCLKSADDYLNAATVFQHGEVPDHFFQTYVWAMKAFNLGKQEAGMMAGNGVDRYLMNLGYKQLFGGQAVTEDTKSSMSQQCFCLWPIDESLEWTPYLEGIPGKLRTA